VVPSLQGVCGLIGQFLYLVIWNAYQVAAISQRKFVLSIMHPEFAFKNLAIEPWGLRSISVEMCHGLFHFSSVTCRLAQWPSTICPKSDM